MPHTSVNRSSQAVVIMTKYRNLWMAMEVKEIMTENSNDSHLPQIWTITNEKSQDNYQPSEFQGENNVKPVIV